MTELTLTPITIPSVGVAVSPPVSAAPANPFFKPKQTDDIPAAAVVAKEQKTLDEGPAILTWPDNMSKESVEELEYWLEGVIRRAKRKAGILPPSRPKPTLDSE